MKIVKPTKLPVLTRVLERDRAITFQVATVLAFSLDDPRGLFDEITFWKSVSSVIGDRGIFDDGLAKARGELLVAGSFFAPGGVPVGASYVRARVGSVDKRIAVLGDRYWKDGVPSEPVPIATLSVDWTRAYGGQNFARNPHGKGAEPLEKDGGRIHLLPNLEEYGALVRSPDARPEPACFLPMGLEFAQRRARAGTYDARYAEEYFPGLPADVDPCFFQSASSDQWASGFFAGDEAFVVENMHPDRPRIEGRLPALATRAFVTLKASHDADESPRFVEIPLRFDTVWLFPSAGMGAIIAHGAIRTNEDDAADIVHLVCACEDPASPRDAAHYERVLSARLDKDRGALASLSNAELMPARETGVAPNHGQTDVGRWLRSAGLLAQNAARGRERQFNAARERVLAEGRDPKDHGLESLPPEPNVPDPDDLDAVAAFMNGELAKVEAERAAIDARAEEARAKARASFAEHGMDYDEAMQRAQREGAGPPTFSSSAELDKMRKMAREAREAGVPLLEVEARLADPRTAAELDEQERRLLDMYRRTAHLSPAARAMDEDASHRARIIIGLAIESGESLARRDFTGARLAKVSLKDADLREALFEAADLSGADLRGASAEGAVLSRADLRGADLSCANLCGANLGGADLQGARLVGARLTGATLRGAKLEGAQLEGASFERADLVETELRGVDFSAAELDSCTFIKTDVSDASFARASLRGANFIECVLDGADFSDATLEKVTFVASRGAGVQLRRAHAKKLCVVHGSALPDANFTEADLTQANLRGTDLRGARFDGAKLDGADLSECDATGASLERARGAGSMLVRTRLTRATLRGADLRHAIASKAKIGSADFTGANLYGADLSRVIGDGKTVFAEAELAAVRYLPKAHVKRASLPPPAEQTLTPEAT